MTTDPKEQVVNIQSTFAGNANDEQARNLNMLWLNSDSGKTSDVIQQAEAIIDDLQQADVFSVENVFVDDEFKLKMDVSLVLVILQSILLQITFFSAVSSSSVYSEHLGGTATFSGLVIGIPPAVSAVTLAPIMKIDQGKYLRPIHISCATMILGSVLYALAYSANFLYLILLGRMVQGIGFNGLYYTKRYITDPRVAGVRRRTMLSGFLVLAQGIGLSAGPFFGGLLFKIGYPNSIFNGLTAPGWVMAGLWALNWVACAIWFEDVPQVATPSDSVVQLEDLSSRSPNQEQKQTQTDRKWYGISPRQWGVIVTMCWFAMCCFFILGAWQTNIPVFGAAGPAPPIESPSASSRTLFSFAPRYSPLSTRDTSNSSLSPFHWSPFAAGNFIALGGVTIFPFLFLNLLFARRTQDRHILALGSGLGLAGLLSFLALLSAPESAHVMSYGAFFACWFLVALGFNLATTCTLSLLTKQLPQEWNTNTSLAIQMSNYVGDVLGAVWGGSGVKVGMLNYLGLEIAIIGIGGVMFLTLWRELKAKTG